MGRIIKPLFPYTKSVYGLLTSVLNGGPGGTGFFDATARKIPDLPGRSYRITDGIDKFTSIITILLLSTLLASCSSVRRDGPPCFYVDETKIPNAVPKPEKLAKYGNMRAYDIKGKRYHVMKSSKNYSATGVASWYGSMFHSRKTSSGERYDMLAMTAAHPTLPLPTYVRVKNLNNNREVIVKVNDRGPFKSNRLIDLSYVAAKKLGMLGRGTAKVKVTAIDPYNYGRKVIKVEKKYYVDKRFKVKPFIPNRTQVTRKRTTRQIAMKKTHTGSET